MSLRSPIAAPMRKCMSRISALSLVGFSALCALAIDKPRIVQFPRDPKESPGTILAVPATTADGIHRRNAHLIGPAVGTISVPKEHVLYLIVTPEGASKLHCLTKLNQDDLHFVRAHDVRLPKSGPQDLAMIKGLRDLDLSNTDIDDEGLKDIAKSNLVKLDISKTLVQGPGLARLGNLKQLRDLDIGNNSINDFFAASLVKSLPQLEALNLSETKITDKALESICQLKNLRKLDLEQDKITDTGLGELEKCSTLKSLNLRSTFVSSAGLRRFSKTNSKCKVRH